MVSSGDTDGRIRDWLDDRLQNVSDLDNIDSLIQGVSESKDLILKQLETARRDLDEARQASIQHQAQIDDVRSDQEHKLQALMVRVRKLTRAKSDSEALAKLQITSNSLHELDTADLFINILKEVQASQLQCLQLLKSSEPLSQSLAVSESYSNVHQLLARLNTKRKSAKNPAISLIVRSVEAIVLTLREMVISKLTRELQTLLSGLKWLEQYGEPLPTKVEPSFSNLVLNWLKVQLPDIQRYKQGTSGPNSAPLVLESLRLLLEPLEQRFEFNFYRPSALNRLDKPEVFLEHILDHMLKKHFPFFDSNVQPLLLQAYQGSSIDNNLQYIDVKPALANAVLPIARRKALQTATLLAPQPDALSAFIHKLIQFDTALRHEWLLESRWPGITDEVLRTDANFAIWLQAEKDYVLARYQEIVDAPGSLELDYDSVGVGITKPSKAAILVCELLDGITANYCELASFNYKLRFLVDVQVSIFDSFHIRLEEAFHSRAFGVKNPQSVETLIRLCRIYGSADFLETTLQEWNDHTFFLEMEVQRQALANDNNNVPLITANGDYAWQEDGSALFDQTASAYDNLRKKAHQAITELVTRSARNSLHNYLRISHWAPVSSVSNTPLATSAELDTLLQSLDDLLSMLRRALGSAPLRSTTREVLYALGDVLIDKVIKAQAFSTAGALQFSVDVKAIAQLVTQITGDAFAVTSGLARLNQACTLLNLSVESEDVGMETEKHAVDLVEAYEILMSGSPEQSQELFERLGIDRLSKFDAGRIVVRRIELES